MAMPEAAVYENDLVPRGEHYIRLYRKVGNMQSIAIPQSVSDLANRQFRLRILGMDSRHDERSLVAMYMVCHSPKPPDTRIRAKA